MSRTRQRSRSVGNRRLVRRGESRSAVTGRDFITALPALYTPSKTGTTAVPVSRVSDAARNASPEI